MKRTTISLPDDVAKILELEAQQRRISVSEVVRQAVSAHLGLAGNIPRRIPFAALGASGYTNTARDHEEILAEAWGRARDR
jgi:Arc/MetJ-type ribon-helix-helix transcriptional regulator